VDHSSIAAIIENATPKNPGTVRYNTRFRNLFPFYNGKFNGTLRFRMRSWVPSWNLPPPPLAPPSWNTTSPRPVGTLFHTSQ